MAQKKAPTVKGLVTKFKNLGLRETTSPRQKENGTMSFNDPRTNVSYNFMTSGYYNRINGNTVTTLNPRTVVKRKKNGTVVEKRILVKDRAKQMSRALDNNIVSYRNR